MDCIDQYSVQPGIFFKTYWTSIANILMTDMVYFLGTTNTGIILTLLNTSAKIGERRRKKKIVFWQSHCRNRRKRKKKNHL